MGQLFALSFDSAASPDISFSSNGDIDLSPLFGWGFAWYPGNEKAAMVVKDATSPFNNSLTRVLQDWRHFHSAHFVCHLRGAAKRISQTGTQPFVRSLAGRDFILVHDGDMNIKALRALYSKETPFFEPMGKTDSELAFCLLLNRLYQKKARRFIDFGFAELTTLLRSFAKLGTANFILSDGQDMVFFHGANHQRGLHWTKRKPPHAQAILETDNIRLDLSNPLDINRTVIIAATSPFSDIGWQPLADEQLIVVRRGKVIWDSTNPVLFASEYYDALTSEVTGKNIQFLPPRPIIQAKTQTFHIQHQTIYEYSEAVENSSHTLRLEPVNDLYQELLEFKCSIQPVKIDNTKKIYFEDVFANQSIFFSIDQPYKELQIISESIVKVHAPRLIDLTSTVHRSTIPLVWMPWQRQMMMSYLLPPELPETQLLALSDYAMGFVERNDYDLFETLKDINTTLYQDLSYIPGATTLKSTPFEVFINRQGVCQDFANLMICLARLLSIPARYRVGYIDTGVTNDVNRIRSDASHAWVELYLPYVGWFGFDPTNGSIVNVEHIRIACGRNYRDATPTSGTIYKGGRKEKLTVKVYVTKQSSE